MPRKDKVARYEYQKLWRLKNFERQHAKERENWAKRQEAKLVSRAGRPRPPCCEICGHADGGNSDRHGVVFDHDHTTGAFRAWTCTPCNVIEGMAKDNPERLLLVYSFIKRGGFGPGSNPKGVHPLASLPQAA